ncbi:MAG: hypothetical protein ABIO72_03155 [Patescibacteria group bacterium]
MNTLPQNVERLRIGVLLPAHGDAQMLAYRRAVAELRSEYFPDGSSVLFSTTGPVVEGAWLDRAREEHDRHGAFWGFYPHPLRGEELRRVLASIEDHVWQVYTDVALDPAKSDTRVRILSISRNAVLLMDSDRGAASDSLGGTKVRMEREVTENQGIAWVTDGREIENYLPTEVIHAIAPECPAIQPFDDIGETLRETSKGWKNFDRKKMKFAIGAIEHLELSHLSSQPQLLSHLTEVGNYIRKCNGLAPRATT